MKSEQIVSFPSFLNLGIRGWSYYKQFGVYGLARLFCRDGVAVVVVTTSLEFRAEEPAFVEETTSRMPSSSSANRPCPPGAASKIR